MDRYAPLALFSTSGISLALALRTLLPIRYTKRGGMRFLRIARLQLCWCVCRESI